VGVFIDQSSNVFRELGLTHARMSDETWLGKLVEEPLLLKIPLVRNGNQLTIGADELVWKAWTEK